MLTSMEEVISVAGPELLSQERLGQSLGAMQVWVQVCVRQSLQSYQTSVAPRCCLANLHVSATTCVLSPMSECSWAIPLATVCGGRHPYG
jgi:hypothetical protein